MIYIYQYVVSSSRAFGTFIASALMKLTCNINNFFTKFLPILSVQQSIYNLAKACFLGFSLLVTILYLLVLPRVDFDAFLWHPRDCRVISIFLEHYLYHAPLCHCKEEIVCQEKREKSQIICRYRTFTTKL